MKIVITGKGGAGKTTVAGALARQLARAGHAVVALDCDPNPSLGITLGLGRAQTETAPAVLNSLIALGHTHHDPDPDPEDLLRRFGVDGPDGVRLLTAGRVELLPDSCLCCGSHSTTRKLFSDLPHDGRIVVADLEAGLNDLLWARPGPADLVVAVAEPSAKSVEIVRRACQLARTLGVGRAVAVANRGSVAEADELSRLVGVPAFAVPDDPAIETADRDGVAPIDAYPDSAAVRAVGRLVDWLGPPVVPAHLA